MYRLATLLALAIFPIFLLSQNPGNHTVDSLENALKMAEQDTARIGLLYQLAREYEDIDSLRAFKTGNEILRLSEEKNYLKGIVQAHMALGTAYLTYSDMELAEEYLLKSTELAEKLIKKDASNDNLRLWANGHYNLGVIYGYKGKDDLEIEMTEKVIPIVEQIGDSIFLANIHTNIGIKHINLQQFERGYYSLEEGNKIYVALGNPQESTYNRIQLTLALYQMDSIPQMKPVLDEAKLNLKKYPNDFDNFQYALQEAVYYLGIKEYDLALNALNGSLQYAQGDETSVSYALVYQRLAAVYQGNGNYDKAIEYLTKYRKNSELRNYGSGIFQSYYSQSKIEKETGNFERAYETLDIAITVYDSLEQIQNSERLSALEIKYQKAKNDKEILALQNKNNESALALEQKKSQAYLLAGIIGMLALLLVGGYYYYTQRAKKARRKEQLQQAEVDQLKHEQEAKIYGAMIDGQERERKRLAIDLHDGLGGRLSGISMNLSKLDKDEPKQYPKAQLRKVMKDLDDSLTELRTIARNMMPETLVKFGLQAALKDYCSSMTGKDTKVTLQFYGGDKGIGIQQQVTMYRVIQELINNAIKHAKASEVLVQYIREGNNVDITVEDNGVGFKTKKEDDSDNGMGLSNLRTRVAYLKGNLDFHSQENEGTTVNVHINVDAA